MYLKRILIKDLESHLPDDIDAFICCSSFEARCKTIAQNVSAKRFRWVIIAENENLFEVGLRNTMEFHSRFSSKIIIKMKVSGHSPIITEDAVAYSIANALSQGAKSFLIDTTTFTRETLLILLNYFHKYIDRFGELTFLYTGASEYSVGDLPERMWLSRGIREIRSVLGFPGNIMPARRSHLIILLGFEADRAARLIEQYEPSILSIGYGPKDTSITPAHHEMNVYFCRKLMAMYSNVLKFSFPPNDSLGTKRAIQKQINKFPNTNVIVSGMNTKLSTIGTALAAFDNSEIQLAYAEPDIYNFSGYSAPGSHCYVFDLPLR